MDQSGSGLQRKPSIIEVFLSRYTYGSEIRHAAMDEILDLQFDPDKVSGTEWQKYRLQRVKSIVALRVQLLNDHYMMLENEPGVGYRILMPYEQTAAAIAKYIRTLKAAADTCLREVSGVDRSMLSQSQKQENSEAVAKIRHMKNVMLHEVRGFSFAPAGAGA